MIFSQQDFLQKLLFSKLFPDKFSSTKFPSALFSLAQFSFSNDIFSSKSSTQTPLNKVMLEAYSSLPIETHHSRLPSLRLAPPGVAGVKQAWQGSEGGGHACSPSEDRQDQARTACLTQGPIFQVRWHGGARTAAAQVRQ